MTLYDSTRERGTNNMRCLYLQCDAKEVTDATEATRAFKILYPNDEVDLDIFMQDGIKHFYCAIPTKAWLNCLSEKELEPTTVKMREEVDLATIKDLLGK